MSTADDAGKFLAVLRSLRFFARQPKLGFFLLAKLSQAVRGIDFGERYHEDTGRDPNPRLIHDTRAIANPLRDYFQSRHGGRGIWKWDHYFDVYHQHLSKFVGRPVNVLEIGVYSGGSLEMWRNYFGEKCYIYGVDIAQECTVYNNEYTQILIGDQEDREFWRKFRQLAPKVDIIIDDGGHSSEQQIVTLEEMLPHINPGGVYICEDVHGVHKGFASFTYGLINTLNSMNFTDSSLGSEGGITPSPFQAWIQAIHFYPYVVVLEKSYSPVQAFTSCRRGTEWQPIAVPGAVALPGSAHAAFTQVAACRARGAVEPVAAPK